MITDRAYEGNEARQLALDLGLIPIAPPHPLRVAPSKVKKAWHRRRNAIERLVCRLNGFRRTFRRIDKVDVMFMPFPCFALVVEALR